jgi:hypothetical protein
MLTNDGDDGAGAGRAANGGGVHTGNFGRFFASLTARWTASTPVAGITKPVSSRLAAAPIEENVPLMLMRSLPGKNRASTSVLESSTLLPWSATASPVSRPSDAASSGPELDDGATAIGASLGAGPDSTSALASRARAEEHAAEERPASARVTTDAAVTNLRMPEVSRRSGTRDASHERPKARPWRATRPDAPRIGRRRGEVERADTLRPLRSPRARHRASPALRFLRAILLRSPTPDVVSAWRDRLAAGGIVREVAREIDFRRSLPLVDRWLSEAGLFERLPADERSLLAAARLAGEASAARLGETLTPLGAAARSEGVAPLLLKGAALHGTLYAAAALRPVSDGDLYVPPHGLFALRRALAAADLSPDAMTAARLADLDASGGRAFRLSDLVYRRADERGLPVEVKLDPVQVGLPLRRGDAFLEGATPSPCYAGFVVPAPEAMAVQQAIHLARHDGSDLLWWAELARGVATARGADGATRFDVVGAERLLAGEGLLGTARAAFEEAERLFPGSIPSALRRGAKRTGPTLARFRSQSALAPPANERAATLSLQAAHAASGRQPMAVIAAALRRVWPSDAYVRARMGLPADAPVRLATRGRRLLQTLRGRAP